MATRDEIIELSRPIAIYEALLYHRRNHLIGCVCFTNLDGDYKEILQRRLACPRTQSVVIDGVQKILFADAFGTEQLHFTIQYDGTGVVNIVDLSNTRAAKGEQQQEDYSDMPELVDFSSTGTSVPASATQKVDDEEVVNTAVAFLEIFHRYPIMKDDFLAVAGFTSKNNLFDAIMSGQPLSARVKRAAATARKYTEKNNN